MQDKIKVIKEKIKITQLIKGVPTERIILGIFLVLLVSFLLYQSLIAAQLIRLRAIDLQFNSQKQLADFYNQIMKQADIYVDEAKDKEDALSKIKENFISEEELSGYFDKFRSFVKSQNLEIISLDFKPPEIPQDLGGGEFEYFQRLPFDISVKGDYFSVVSLLYKLEQAKLTFDIKSIRVTPENSAGTSVVMNINACVYILMKKS